MDCFSLSFLLRLQHLNELDDDNFVLGFGLKNDEECDTVTACSVDVSLNTNMFVILSRLRIRRKTSNDMAE